MNVCTFHDHTAHEEGEQPLAQLTLSFVQWCHLQLEATLFFLQSPIFSVCYHYIIPPLNKEQQILTCLLYSPYMLDLYPLPTVNSTCSRFHCTCRYREGGAGPLGDLVSCRLKLPSGNPGIFLFAQHYVCLPVSGEDMTAGRHLGRSVNCPPKFPLLLSLLVFL